MKKITTTKKYAIFLFTNCVVIELYSMVAMWHMEDLSALYALITAVIGECIVYCTYSLKSASDHKLGIFDGFDPADVDMGECQEGEDDED